MPYHTIILRGTQRRFCQSEYFLAHQQIPHPLSLHVPRTKTQPSKYQNLAGLVLYSLSIAFQSIFAVRFPHTDTRLPSVRHRKFSLASSVFHNVRHQPQIPFYENIPRFQIPLPRQIQIVPFLFLRQRAGKAARGQLQ